MTSFEREGWSFPEVHRDQYNLKPLENPFVFDPDNIDPSVKVPEDPRLNPYRLVERWSEYVSESALEALVDPQRQSWSESPGLASPVTDVDQDSADYLASFFENANANCVKKSKWIKDEWKKGPGCWIRVHKKPRRSMFVPTGTMNGPVISTLSGARVTRISYLDGSKEEVKSDNWLVTDMQLHCLPKKWTGCTVFQLGNPAHTGGTRIGSTEGAADSPLRKPTNQFATKLDSERNNPFSDVWKSFLSTPDPVHPPRTQRGLTTR